MTDEKDPPPEPAPVRRYRFRVRTSDGRELISHVASVRLPPKAPAQEIAPEVEPGPAREVEPAPPQEIAREVEPALAALAQVKPSLASVAPGKSYVPTRILVDVQGMKQGAFKPDKGAALDKHQFRATELEFGIAMPRDAATGQATGQRRHHPVVLTKELGPSSPQFRSALAENETLTSVSFACYGVEQKGGSAEVEFFTLKLTNASVADATLVMPNNRHPELAKVPTHEQLSFTYQTIEWTWKDGGISAQDDWVQP